MIELSKSEWEALKAILEAEELAGTPAEARAVENAFRLGQKKSGPFTIINCRTCNGTQSQREETGECLNCATVKMRELALELYDGGTTMATVSYTRAELKELIARASAALEVG